MHDPSNLKNELPSPSVNLQGKSEQTTISDETEKLWLQNEALQQQLFESERYLAYLTGQIAEQRAQVARAQRKLEKHKARRFSSKLKRLLRRLVRR